MTGKYFLKSIVGGMLISISTIAYMLIENKLVGAFVFSFGLLTILIQDAKLFTGQIGFCKDVRDFVVDFYVLCGNIVGCCFIACLLVFSKQQFILGPIADQMMNAKLESYWSIIISSIFCGMMMQIAVLNWMKTKNILLVMLPIAIFIICGFEHSIVNIFICQIYGFTWKVLGYILMNIAGNAIGAMFMNRIMVDERV